MPKIEAIQENEPIIKGRTRGNQGITFKIRISDALYADFDIFGFVRNSIDYAKWKKTIGNQLVETLEALAMKLSGYAEIKKDILEKMKKKILDFEKGVSP